MPQKKLRENNLYYFFAHRALISAAENCFILTGPAYLYATFNTPMAHIVWTSGLMLTASCGIFPIFIFGQRCKTAKGVMAFGLILNCLCMLALSLFKLNPLLLAEIATLYGFALCSYYLSMHWFYSSNIDLAKVGRHTTLWLNIQLLVGAITPVVCGLLSEYSYHANYFLLAVFAISSLIPLFAIKTNYPNAAPTITEILSTENQERYRELKSISHFEQFASTLLTNLWPLAYCMLIGNIGQFGILTGASVLLTAFLLRTLGKTFDSNLRHGLVERLAFFRVATGLLYATTLFFPHWWYVLAVDILNRLSESLIQGLSQSYLYALSSKYNPVAFHYTRELNLIKARPWMLLLLLAWGISMPPDSIWILLTIGALCNFGWLFLKRAEKILNHSH